MKLILIIVGIIFIILICISLIINYRLNLVKIVSITDPETQETKEIPLKKCPFCGADKADIISEELEQGDKKISVYAMTCSDKIGGCGCMTGFYLKPLDAILAWNERPYYYEN